MNLRRHLNVLWRFRLIVAIGCALGVVLGVLAVFQVDSSGLSWRAEQTWQSESKLYVTQPGFPDGRVVLGDTTQPANSPEAQASAGQFADPGRFTNLAIIYSSFVQSDRVRAMVRPTPAPNQLTMTPLPAAANSPLTLPIATLTTTTNNAADAVNMNKSAIVALQEFLEDEQERNDISKDNRVRVEVLNPPRGATILIDRSKTPAIVAFILCLSGAVALAYCLDNLRPPPPSRLDTDLPELEELDAAWEPEFSSSISESRRAS